MKERGMTTIVPEDSGTEDRRVRRRRKNVCEIERNEKNRMNYDLIERMNTRTHETTMVANEEKPSQCQFCC